MPLFNNIRLDAKVWKNAKWRLSLIQSVLLKFVALVVILLNYIQLSIIKILIDYCLEGKAYEIIFKSLHSCISIIITAEYGINYFTSLKDMVTQALFENGIKHRYAFDYVANW